MHSQFGTIWQIGCLLLAVPEFLGSIAEANARTEEWCNTPVNDSLEQGFEVEFELLGGRVRLHIKGIPFITRSADMLLTRITLDAAGFL
jgi:hypothetical protein